MALEPIVIDEGDKCRVDGLPPGYSCTVFENTSERLVYMGVRHIGNEKKAEKEEIERARDINIKKFEAWHQAYKASFRKTYFDLLQIFNPSRKMDPRLVEVAQKHNKADAALCQKERELSAKEVHYDFFMGKKGEVLAHKAGHVTIELDGQNIPILEFVIQNGMIMETLKPWNDYKARQVTRDAAFDNAGLFKGFKQLSTYRGN